MKTSTKKIFLVSLLMAVAAMAFAQKNSDFMFTAVKHPKAATYDAIDQYASNLTFSTSTSYQQAATKICAKSKTDIERARAIFAWIGHNIEYDVGLNSSYCYSADGVWQHRKGACDGYAGLYVQLAKAVGLNVQKVSGQTKYDSSDYGSSLGSHSWILVHLADRDMLMDPTWGAGSVSGPVSSQYPYGDTFTYSYKDYWFDVDPYIMITTHFTSSKELQVLPVAVTLDQFKVLPGINPAFGKAGIDGKELFDFLLTHNKTWGQYTYRDFGDMWKKGVVVNKTLMTRNLKTNESYTINYTFPSDMNLSITVDDKTNNLTSGQDYTFKPTTTSNVYLGIKTPKSNGGWSINYFARFTVSANPSFAWQSKAATLLSQLKSDLDRAAKPATTPSTSGTSSGATGSSNSGTGTNTGSGTGSTTTGSNTTTNTNGTTTNTTTNTTSTSQQTKKQGLNKPNLSTVTYTLLDGTKVDNQAHGKPKVLIFMQTICPRCMQTSKNVSSAYNTFNDVDLYEIEIRMADKATVQKFKDAYAIPAMKFSSDTTGANNSSMWQYIRSMMSTSSIQLPFIVFIDSNNKIQHQVSGQIQTAAQIRSIIDDYLIPISSQSTTTTNSTTTNATTGQTTNTRSTTTTNTNGNQTSSSATTVTNTTSGQGSSTTVTNTTTSTTTGQTTTTTTTTTTTSGQGTNSTTNTTSSRGTSTTTNTSSNTTSGQGTDARTNATGSTTSGQATTTTTTKPKEDDCDDGDCEIQLPASRARKQGINKANPISQTYNTVNGQKITTSAEGKPKILIFFAASCGRTKNFLKKMNSEYGSFKDVDICFIETRKAKQKAVATFQGKYAIKEMNIAYDTSGNAKKAMDTYHKTFLPKVKTINTPMFIFIDGNNIVQQIEHGKALTPKEVRNIVDDYLVPVK